MAYLDIRSWTLRFIPQQGQFTVHLADAAIKTLYTAPTAGNEYILPAVLPNYGQLMSLEFMSEFKVTSDSMAESGETRAQKDEREFGHALKLLMLFAAGYILTQGVRKSDLQSKSAHESFNLLVNGAATSKYYGSAMTAALVSGQSTKSMSGGPEGAFCRRRLQRYFLLE